MTSVGCDALFLLLPHLDAPVFTVTYKDLTYTTVTAKTAQRACRCAFNYWINQKLIPRQPKTSNDWSSSFEGVEVEKT